jgi:hypothetical protein
MKFQLLQTISSVQEYSDNDIIDVSVKGWNHPKDWFEKFIIPELTEYYSEPTTFRLMVTMETGYTSSRYFEGEDANEAGFSTWLNFEKYRKGLGKATIYTIQILGVQ